MRNRKLKRFLEKKAFLLVLLLCVLSAAGMYGVYRMELGKNGDNNVSVSEGLMDLNEMTEEQELAMEQEKKVQMVNGPAETVSTTIATSTTETIGSDPAAEEITKASEKNKEVMAQKRALSFSQSENIKWPVKGNIILDYSPEKTVYFATLEQYRCNPAVLIQAEAGSPVTACADGVIKEIKASDELGTTVTLDLGNGYEAVYGQVSGVKKASGDSVSTGDTLAVVAAPSRYYSVEGSHVYFQMLKDGIPVNPRGFLE